MTIRRATGIVLDDRRGIALPLVLMLTVFLTISVGAGFVIAGNEHTVGVDHDAQLKAFAAAQEGVENYLVNVTTIPATFPDVKVISVTGGVDTVTMRVVKSDASGVSAIYSITSVGNATSSNLRRSASTPVAQRTVSQLVVWQSGTMDATAAWTSLSGMDKNGNSGTASGFDVVDPTTGCGGTSAAVPRHRCSRRYDVQRQEYFHQRQRPGIRRRISELRVRMALRSTRSESIGRRFLAGSVAPDFTIKTTSPASGSWPTASQYNNWPVVLVKGKFGNGVNVSGGKGILLVTGDADLSNFDWHGIVLVGGALTLSGSKGQVWGTAISGLNIELGQTVLPSSVGNGNILAQYNSCDVSKALANFGGWRRIQNSWSDNWPSYTVP